MGKLANPGASMCPKPFRRGLTRTAWGAETITACEEEGVTDLVVHASSSSVEIIWIVEVAGDLYVVGDRSSGWVRKIFAPIASFT